MNKIRIFSTSTEYMDWLAHNCFRCKKFNTAELDTCKINCEFGRALSIDNGKIDFKIAERSGCPIENGFAATYKYTCAEIEELAEMKEIKK